MAETNGSSGFSFSVKTKTDKINFLTAAWWFGVALTALGALIHFGFGGMLMVVGVAIIVGACVGLIYQGLPHGGWEDRKDADSKGT